MIPGQISNSFGAADVLIAHGVGNSILRLLVQALKIPCGQLELAMTPWIGCKVCCLPLIAQLLADSHMISIGGFPIVVAEIKLAQSTDSLSFGSHR
jgi:hypothetical protein